jgi:hypothetical protein
VDVTLIGRRNFHLFQSLLHQVATGSLSPGETRRRCGACSAARRTHASFWAKPWTSIPPQTVVRAERGAHDGGTRRPAHRPCQRSPK